MGLQVTGVCSPPEGGAARGRHGVPAPGYTSPLPERGLSEVNAPLRRTFFRLQAARGMR